MSEQPTWRPSDKRIQSSRIALSRARRTRAGELVSEMMLRSIAGRLRCRNSKVPASDTKGRREMERNTLHFGAGVLALMIGIALVAGRVGADASPQAKTTVPKHCRAASLAGLKSDGVRTKSVTEVPAGSFTPPGAQTLANLPAFCRVVAVVAVASPPMPPCLA